MTIFISTAEPSGDVQGAALAVELKRRHPGLKVYGMGGQHMRAGGVELIADSGNFGAIGPSQGLLKIPAIYLAYRKIRRALLDHRPDLVIIAGTLNWSDELGTPDDFGAALRHIVQAVKATGTGTAPAATLAAFGDAGNATYGAAACGSAGWPLAAGTGTVSAAPHAVQNLSPAAAGWPHCGQRCPPALSAALRAEMVRSR